MSHPIESMLGVSMEKIREMVDVNTIIGSPMSTPDGEITIIPVSKVSFGFGSGGSDIPTKKDGQNFGGAAGAGVTISPLAFLVVKKDNVELLQISDESGKLSKILESIPGAMNKVLDMFKKKKKEKDSNKE